MSVFIKINLTPLDKFFFGGEVVFGGEDAQDKRRRSYLVKSNLLPQQTSLLGMIREQLLRQNNLLLQPDDNVKNQKKVMGAIKLVGRQGVIDDANAGDFGIIESISPLVLEDDKGTQWHPLPIDQNEGKDGNNPMRFIWEDAIARPLMENLDPKKQLQLQFTAKGNSPKALDKFFAADEQVGITVTNRKKASKNQGLDDEDEAFYRQTFRKNYNSTFAENLNPEDKNHHPKTPYSFAFWVELADEYLNLKPLINTHVHLGGERSRFNMKVESVNTAIDFEQIFKEVSYPIDSTISSEFQRIVLTSDAYADWQTLKKDCALIFAQTIPFRYFYTPLGVTTHFYDFKAKHSTGKHQSNLITLLQRGGVLYVHKSKINDVVSHLSNKAFRQIGYNYFKTF